MENLESSTERQLEKKKTDTGVREVRKFVQLSYLLNITGKIIKQMREAMLTNSEHPIAWIQRPIKGKKSKIGLDPDNPKKMH